MFDEMKKNYKFLAEYFTKLLENGKFDIPNSIILYGSDILAQYYIAMLIAKTKNCTGDKSSGCNCRNCLWIKRNEHPEIMTISKIDSKPDNDDSKTVISVKQTDNIKDKLIVSSEYHRFFIFCDAEDKIYTENEEKRIKDFEKWGISLPKTAKNGWYPKGITPKCFSDVVANSLLKSIEEPPSNVTFIFLTENIENIIPTIVSRSQAFFVSGFEKSESNISDIAELMRNYPDFNENDELKISDKLMEISEKNGQNLSDTLDGIQNYLVRLLENNFQNKIFSKKIMSDIDKLHDISNMLRSNIKEQTAADETGYLLTQKVK